MKGLKKLERIEGRIEGLSPASEGQNLALTVLHVPYSLDIGGRVTAAVAQCLPSEEGTTQKDFLSQKVFIDQS